MSTTVQQIYKKALALYDEISKTGSIDPSKTKDYEVRTPDMVDMFQKELILNSNATKVYPYDYVPDTTKTWNIITLPTDAFAVIDVKIDTETSNYIPYTGYEIEKDGAITNMYVQIPYECTVKVKYEYIPTAITAMTDTLQIDDMRAQGIAYALCKWFALSEQNNYVAEICDKKYEQLKKSIKQPVKAVPIIDAY